MGAPFSYDLGSISEVRRLTVDDINNDGLSDIIFTDPNQNRVGLLINLGDFKFDSPLFIDLTDSPAKVITEDIDGDGSNDIAALTSSSNSIALIFNKDQDWNESEFQYVNVGALPIDAKLVDLDQDGNIDLTVVGQGMETARVFYSIKNSPDEFEEIALNVQPDNIEIADFDSNQIPDLAIISKQDSVLQLVLRNADRTVKETIEYPSSIRFSTADFLVDDINSDSHPDIVVNGSKPAPFGNVTNDTYLHFFINDGNGSFQLIEQNYNYTFNGLFFSVSFIDLLGTGEKGFLFANAEDIKTHLTYPNTSFKGIRFTEFPMASDINKIALGDINNDGFIDLAIANRQFQFVTLKLGNGLDHFEDYYHLESEHRPSKIKLVDLNLDGSLDLVTGGFKPSIYLNDGSGLFTNLEIDLNQNVHTDDITVGDVNNDQYPDLLANGSLYLNNEGTSFSRHIVFDNLNTKAHTFGDFDNDSNLDVAISPSASEVIIHRGDGTGQFTFHSSFSVKAFEMEVGDLNGDGFDDLIADGSSSTDIATIYFGSSELLTSNGKISFGRDGFNAGIQLFDFDQDDKMDIVSASYTDVFYHSISNGFLGGRKLFDIGKWGFYRDIFPFDYDRDGDLEIVLTDHYEKIQILNKQKTAADLSVLNQVYDGSPVDNFIVSDPLGLAFKAYHNGSLNLPKDVGYYPFVAYIQDEFYDGWIQDTVWIDKAHLDVIAQDTSKHQFQKNPDFQIAFDSLFGNDVPEDIDLMPSISTSATELSSPGDYDILLAGGSDNNYELNLVNGTLTIFEPLSLNKHNVFEYYPNPLQNSINIKSSTHTIEKITITDLSGKLMKSIDNLDTNTELNLDLTDLGEGQYIMILNSGTKREAIRIRKEEVKR